MGRISGQAVAVAFLLIIASGVLGLYLGYSRAAAAPGGRLEEDAVGVATAGVAAKAASPIPDATAVAPTPDEAFIRKIAQQEIQAALHPQHHAAAATSDESDSSSDDDSDSGSSGPAAQHAAATAAATAPQEAAPAAPPPASPPPPTPY